MRLITALLLAFALVACSRVTSENYQKISTGMQRDEVVRILGEPKATDGGSVFGISGESASWQGSDTTITIQFINGKVMTKNLEKK
ncbi:hypothetical protein [Jeongeupia chitinilytica]|uniref:DUF3862 domain-containing protein n=1 Tax=Jeongeupia chitinilytica TaxID=1041641 RepID=A0ABQ3H3M2_9NEIS|nr:hypothetical protein [Jeongeupia chitinilytica]GHD68570.1 hypothetical protein GCM10007350_34180 [Jeongeupia chitinilytica]